MHPCCCWTAFFNSVMQMLPFLAVFGIVGERIVKFRAGLFRPKPVEETSAPCCGDIH